MRSSAGICHEFSSHLVLLFFKTVTNIRLVTGTPLSLPKLGRNCRCDPFQFGVPSARTTFTVVPTGTYAPVWSLSTSCARTPLAIQVPSCVPAEWCADLLLFGYRSVCPP